MSHVVVEPPDEVVFSYEEQLEELVPPDTGVYNPYYLIADLYEPLDDSLSVPTDDPAMYNISRGHGKAINMSLLGSDLEVGHRDIQHDFIDTSYIPLGRMGAGRG